MAPLRAPATLGAASAPVRVSSVELSFETRARPPFSVAALCWRVAGAGGGKLALRHNKPMHPTADTRAVIFGNRSGRRVIGGVMLLRFG